MDKKETVKYREEAMELAAFIKESPTPFPCDRQYWSDPGKRRFYAASGE